MQECFICKDTFKLQRSHDIPKYIGGLDSDGIRILCIKHHQEYDKFLLQKYFSHINEYQCLDDWNDVKKGQIDIKKLKQFHPVFKQITIDILKYYFNSNPTLINEYDIKLCSSCKTELDYEDFVENICPKCFRYIGELEDGW